MLPRYWTSDEYGVLSPDPNYLVGEEVVSTSPLVVRLQLNPAAVWADGHPITWEDVRAPLLACQPIASADGPEQERTEQVVLPCADTVGASRIAGVARGVNDHEAVITFTGPCPQWRELVSAPGRAELFADPVAFDWEQIDTRAQAGPFVVEDWDPATGVLSERRNARWWGTPAALDRVTFRWLPTMLQASAFVNNEVDVVSTALDSAATAKVLGVADGAIRTCHGQTHRTLLFRQDGILASTEVRRAVALAVDRSALQAADVADTGTSSAPILNRFLTPTAPGHRDNTGALGSLGDAGAADRLLAEAGWIGAPVRFKDDQELRLEYLWSTEDPAGRQDADLLQEQLASIGVALAPVEVDAGEFDARIRAGAFQLATANLPTDVRPELSFRSDSALNLTGVADPQLDEWLDAIGAGPQADPGVANEVDRWLWEQAVTLPLYVVPDSIGIRANLANFGANGRATVRWEEVGFVR